MSKDWTSFKWSTGERLLRTPLAYLKSNTKMLRLYIVCIVKNKGPRSAETGSDTKQLATCRLADLTWKRREQNREGAWLKTKMTRTTIWSSTTTQRLISRTTTRCLRASFFLTSLKTMARLWGWHRPPEFKNPNSKVQRLKKNFRPMSWKIPCRSQIVKYNRHKWNAKIEK
jgi:hypothetical protein